jgi:ankyrin repeat protein
VDDFFRGVEIDAPNVVQAALDAGVDPNTRDAQGQVGLFLALRGEAAKVVELLLRHPKIDIDPVNASGETPVMMAALRGRLELTRQLLDRGAAVNREGWTPLHYAASGPEPKVVSLLLDRGAQIDALSPNGTTPLMMAARYGAIDSAELLRQRGADLNRRNQRGLSAADFASAAGRETLAARLQRR